MQKKKVATGYCFSTSCKAHWRDWVSGLKLRNAVTSWQRLILLVKMVNSEEDHASFTTSIGPSSQGVKYLWLVLYEVFYCKSQLHFNFRWPTDTCIIRYNTHLQHSQTHLSALGCQLLYHWMKMQLFYIQSPYDSVMHPSIPMMDDSSVQCIIM